jgi:hypothetical protein
VISDSEQAPIKALELAPGFLIGEPAPVHF